MHQEIFDAHDRLENIDWIQFCTGCVDGFAETKSK